MKVEDARGAEEALRLVAAAPELAKWEREDINDVFPSYIFRVRKKRELWTTCCGRHKVLTAGKETAAERVIMDAPHAPEPKVSYGRQLNHVPPNAACPYCGKLGAVKELGRTGGRGNLSAYRRVVAMRWYRGKLWARAYQCAKHYTFEDKLCDPPIMGLVGVWSFHPGETRQALRSYWWWSKSFSDFSFHRQDGPLQKGKWNVLAQFGYNNEEGCGYSTVGMDEVAKSPFRWCGCDTYERRYSCCLKFLTACCFYPRQIEMFMKAGMDEVVHSLAERGIKNAKAFRWEETNPVKGFGLTKQELRSFMAGIREIEIVSLYKRLRRMGEAVTVERTEEIYRKLFGMTYDWLGLAKRWGVSPMKVYRYFERQNESPGRAMVAWKDYTSCAEKLGYALHRSNVLLPPDLEAAHDTAAEERRWQLQEERRRTEEERQRAEIARLDRMKADYEPRRKELERKFAVTLGGFVISVPEGSQAIYDEGRILKHCVAGYAERHMAGKTVILFMRPEGKQDTPFLTIEMDGKKLKQIHGYRNEGVYSQKGRFAPDPREAYRDILDPWLNWVEGGSRRNQKGQPVGLFVTKTEVETA